jgi:hypothetical protein
VFSPITEGRTADSRILVGNLNMGGICLCVLEYGSNFRRSVVIVHRDSIFNSQ